MSIDRKDNDTPKENELDYLKNIVSKRFFVKCYMQNMPHGEEFLAVCTLIAEANPEYLNRVIFQFDPDSKDILYYTIQQADVPGTGLPAVMIRHWKKEPSEMRESADWNGYLKGLFQIDHFLQRNTARHLPRYRGGVFPEIDKHINSMSQYYRIPDLDALRKIPKMNRQLTYVKDYKDAVDRYRPETKAQLIEFFDKLHGRFFTPGLINVIASYAFDPAGLIEKYLDSIGNEFNLHNFLQMEIILFPEIAPKAQEFLQKFPAKKEEPPQNVSP